MVVALGGWVVVLVVFVVDGRRDAVVVAVLVVRLVVGLVVLCAVVVSGCCFVLVYVSLAMSKNWKKGGTWVLDSPLCFVVAGELVVVGAVVVVVVRR